jgi:phosphoglycolate phosphatase-like HAD superfamily hydrolase
MIEHLRPGASAANARVALFDFDGTISVIRSGWMEIMIPMMVEILLALAEEIEKRGGTPLDPLEYKNRYLALLNDQIRDTISELREERCSPEKYLVPGARALLESLKERGLKMYLASGTDQIYMREEARLLDVVRYFDGGVYGALDDYKAFSKKILIQRLIASSEFEGEQFLGFGDGYVEIENVKEVGGVTVGVATAEPECLHVDEWKRKRLSGVGADFIIPNYLCHDELLGTLFPA